MTLCFGAHVSIAGGVCNAIEHAERIGCDSFQIFVKPNRQWKLPAITEDDADFFHKKALNFSAYPIAHSSYLLNPEFG